MPVRARSTIRFPGGRASAAHLPGATSVLRRVWVTPTFN